MSSDEELDRSTARDSPEARGVPWLVAASHGPTVCFTIVYASSCRRASGVTGLQPAQVDLRPVCYEFCAHAP
jgi:hypothetical protein